MTNDIKPCPFCGGEAELLKGEECALVVCQENGRHRGPFIDGDNNAASEAVAEWNRRTGEGEALAALKVVMQHGRIDDSESRMQQVATAIAKLEGSR